MGQETSSLNNGAGPQQKTSSQNVVVKSENDKLKQKPPVVEKPKINQEPAKPKAQSPPLDKSKEVKPVTPTTPQNSAWLGWGSSYSQPSTITAKEISKSGSPGTKPPVVEKPKESINKPVLEKPKEVKSSWFSSPAPVAAKSSTTLVKEASHPAPPPPKAKPKDDNQYEDLVSFQHILSSDSKQQKQK